MKLTQSGAWTILAALAALCCAGQPAIADTVVATIDGCYDCAVYDTPTITIENTSGGALVNVKLTATGYQAGTLDYGLAQSKTLASIASGTNYSYSWLDGYPAVVKGDLFSYDMDDSFGNTPSGYTNSACVLGNTYCADVGNFSLLLTATISGGVYDGKSVYSIFSPTSNLTGGFLGFEGLNPDGVSESIYDEHSGSNSTVNGGLAQILLGTPTTASPEPCSMLLLGAGLVGVAVAKRRFSN